MSPTAEPGGRAVRLKVQKADQSVHTIELMVGSEAAAVQHAVTQGWRVLALEGAAGSSSAGRRAGAFPLLLFSQELLALLEAGLNLGEAIQTLYAKHSDGAAKEVLAQMVQALQEGRNFSDVLEASPQHFPTVYVATVRAAERTGDLPKALARYIAYQMQFDALRKKLISAAIYPVVLLVVGGLVTLFLLGYVVPRFSAVYESSGRPLPWLSMVLLQFGQWVHAHGALAVSALAVAVGGTGWALSRPAGRTWLLQRVLALPWLARQTAQFRLARFFRAVSLLLASGVALPRAMGMVTGLLGPQQQLALAQARRHVEQGRSLSAALQEAGLSSPVADSLIKVGERSGQMADMLERTARFHDDDFSRWIDWTSRLLEPVLMAIIGVVIGAVVVLMYMPIFELAGSLQ